MLERVGLGQSRFMTPGVAPDPRGVLLGRYGVLLFPTLEGVVSWLRLYSAESSMDELIPSMAICRAVTPLKSRELLVRIPATSSYTLDRAARCAKLVGGATFTGTAKHFVKYRDDRSPYGYDAVTIQALPRTVDLMLHGDEFTQTYAVEGELAFEKLLFRLSLRRVPGGDKLGDDERGELLLAIARGLGDGVIRYLWRNRVRAEVGLVRPKGDSAFDDHDHRSFLVARVRDLPARILELFIATPGIDVFRTVAPNVAVQVGFSHMLDLASCASVFADQSFYLFWAGDRVDVVGGPLELSEIENLTEVAIDIDRATDPHRNLDPSQPDPVGVDLRLAPSLNPPRRVIATLVPLAETDRVKRLVFLLPPTALAGHQVAVTNRGVLLVAAQEIDVIPLGRLLSELAPGLLVPLGMDLVPRVAPEVLARSLGHGTGLLTVFPGDGAPFQVSEAALMPLERRAVAKLEIEETTTVDTRLRPPGDPDIVNDPVGRFALWGFKGPEED